MSIQPEKIIVAAVITLVLAGTFLFDKGLSLGLALFLSLCGLTLIIFEKIKIKSKRAATLFLLAVIVHLAIALFMHYAHFQPFSGGKGDYINYQRLAEDLSQQFLSGSFSLDNYFATANFNYPGHIYPVILAAIYALTVPAEIIGLLINAWLVAVTVLLSYLLILEIGGSEKSASLAGIIITFYPSLSFNGGLLLKDPLAIFSAVFALLFLVKAVNSFSWRSFFLFYLSVISATHFRFYVGYAVIFTFLLSWFLFSGVVFRKKLILGLFFLIIMGFAPQIAGVQGYYGSKPILTLLNPQMISFYRKSAYNPESQHNSQASFGQTVLEGGDASQNLSTKNPEIINLGKNESSLNYSNDLWQDNSTPIGLGSSFQVQDGLLGYVESFMYTLLGPLPWQIKSSWQALALFETIPWYLLLCFVGGGIISCFYDHNKKAISLLMFSVTLMGAIAIFDSNFGLITRIRTPAFISLICIAALSFNENNRLYNYLKNIYEKVSSYRRRRFYRFQHS